MARHNLAERKANERAALPAVTLINMFRAKGEKPITLQEFLGEDDEDVPQEVEQTSEQMKAIAKAITLALGGKIVSGKNGKRKSSN